ncbi:hypothetical protein EV702DRAFT_524847 [Suillus placidus]|uniref:Secreted protein n=1 Tax=Suillus placidus TaxID=48579 RepID=A0A9P6ZPM0_9AGAM|nr:hypothetical protein EV702DRAFT_524847 [Suillus placidus]
MPFSCSLRLFLHFLGTKMAGELLAKQIIVLRNSSSFLFDIFLGFNYNQEPGFSKRQVPATKVKSSGSILISTQMAVSLFGTWSRPGRASGKLTMLQVCASSTVPQASVSEFIPCTALYVSSP